MTDEALSSDSFPPSTGWERMLIARPFLGAMQNHGNALPSILRNDLHELKCLRHLSGPPVARFKALIPHGSGGAPEP